MNGDGEMVTQYRMCVQGAEEATGGVVDQAEGTPEYRDLVLLLSEPVIWCYFRFRIQTI